MSALVRAKKRARHHTTEIHPYKHPSRVTIGGIHHFRGGPEAVHHRMFRKLSHKQYKHRKHTNKEVQDIMYMFMDPEDGPMLRLSNPYNQIDTAMAKLHYNLEFNIDPTLSPGVLALPPTDFGAFLFRDPLRALIYYVQTGFDASDSSNYPVYRAVTNQDQTGNLNCGPIRFPSAEVEQWYDINYMQLVSGTPFHGQTLYAGKALDNKKYIWINGGDLEASPVTSTTVTFTLSVASSVAITCECWRYSGGSMVLANFGAISPSATTDTVELAISGYYAFRVYSVANPSGFVYWTFSITQKNSSGWAHRCIPQLENQVNNISSIRVVAASLRIANNSAEQYKSGFLTMNNFNGRIPWYDQLALNGVPGLKDPGDWSTMGAGTGFYNAVFTSSGERALPLNTGMYAFHKCNGPDDLKPKDWISSIYNNQIQTAPEMCFQLETDDAYIAAAGDVTVEGAGNMLILAHFIVQYETSNQWIELQGAEIPFTAFDEALQHMASIEQFFENPFHWKGIWDAIKRYAPVGVSIARKAGRVLSNAGIPLGGALTLAAQVGDTLLGNSTPMGK